MSDTHRLMKLCTLMLVFVVCSRILSAQEYSRCTYSYFKTGKVASALCYDAAQRFGKARAYNSQGKMIYENDIRKVGGHASVQFTYYDNGAVKKAEWRSAPDGGIQWYSSVTTFSETGEITGETHNDYDDRPGTTVHYPPRETVRPVTADTPESTPCPVIYSSEFWYINRTGHTVTVTAANMHQQLTETVRPGQILKGGMFILAQQFDDPARYYTFTAVPAARKDKARYAVVPSARKPEQVKKEVRRYYLDIVNR